MPLLVGMLRRSFSSDLQSLARSIMQQNPSIKSSQSVLSSLRRLKDIEGETRLWEGAVSASPAIMDFQTKEIEGTLRVFDRFGISREATWKTIGTHPELLSAPSSFLNTKLSQADGFSRSITVSLETLLILASHVLYLEPEEIGDRMGGLREFFTKSQSDQLVCSSPLVLFEEWRVIRGRIQYLLDVMHVHAKDILDTPGAFDIEDGELSCRYEFLNRAGLYKHPDPKGIDEGLHALPHLRDIVTGSDEEFMKRVASSSALTMEEFLVFAKIFEKEHKEYEKHFDAVGYEDMDYVEVQLEEKEFQSRLKRNPRKLKST